MSLHTPFILPEDLQTLNIPAKTNLTETKWEYMQAVHSTDTVLFLEDRTLPFTPGSPVYQTLQKNTKSVIACNVVSYSQIEGHILAAMAQNALSAAQRVFDASAAGITQRLRKAVWAKATAEGVD